MGDSAALRRLLAAALLGALTGPLLGATAAGPPARDVLFQVEPIDALMAGLYDGTLPLAELTRHGDFGLGTFDRLDGEMVVLAGVVHQVTADGLVRAANPALTTPFAAVTFFDRDITAPIRKEMNLAALKEFLDGLLPTKNLLYAVRIDGTFSAVQTRSVPAQSKPYRKLVEVTASQPVFELTDVQGTIVGFRCPYYVQGINVPGYHLHFLSADRRRGGHILDCTVKTGEATVDGTAELMLTIPRGGAEFTTDFQPGAAGDLQKVEGK